MSRRTPDRRSQQSGSALVIVIFAIAIGLILGAAILQDVTAEGGAARHERNREAAFSLAETGLNSQIFVLGTAWPSTAAGAYPATCSPSGSLVYGCPDSAAMAQALSQADPNDVPVWTVSVRDDGASATSWTEDMLTTQPSWDANADGRVWVRSHAEAQGRPVTVVGLITESPVTAGFPQSVITAGFFATGSQGNTRYVDTVGTAAGPSPITVRCTGSAPSACLDYPPSKGQVSPDTTTTGYTGGAAASARVIADFVSRAQRAGTYTASGCPASLAGAVVVIASGDCSYQSNTVWNSQASPGVLVLLDGTLELLGTSQYYGVIYAPNQGNRNGVVVSITGTAIVQGAILVDGPGGVKVDGSALVSYDPGAVNAAQTYLTPQLVKSTWRQL